jgi:hypothetical protein
MNISTQASDLDRQHFAPRSLRKATRKISQAFKAPNRAHLIAGLGALTALLPLHAATAAQLPVGLGASGNYAILAKSGISTVPTSAVSGNMGVSPIDSTAITGFSLLLDSTTQFSTSPQVVGKIYASDYSGPTSANLTTAVSDMETAFADAAGRTLPNHTELGSGNIGGLTLSPGLYKWGTGVTIPTDVTLTGGSNEVWVFQIAGDLTIANGQKVVLSGGAQARNIFWQVSGGSGADFGTSSHFEGILLTSKAINLRTGTSVNGRLLAQTAVTLDSASVTSPSPSTATTIALQSAVLVTGQFADSAGQTVDLSAKSINVPKTGNTVFYRIRSDTPITIRTVTVSGGSVVISYN